MIPQGYKQTEIGIIPEDWELKKISKFAKVCMCKRIFSFQTKGRGDIPFYKIGTFGKMADSYIDKELYYDYRQRFSYPTTGDVLFSAAGTLGRTVVFDGKDSYFQDSNIVWLDIDKTQIINDYLYHYYQVIKWASSEGSTISRLYNGIIYDTNVIFPKDTKEQERIAEALSDTDGLISSLEKLIEKKKAIKQGTMQNLLTGKTRLPGFNKQLENDYFKSFNIKIQKGQTVTKSQLKEGCFPVVAGGRKPAYYCDIYNRDGKTITISASGASAGFVNIYSGKIFASDCSTVSESKDYDIMYIYYLLLNQQEKIYLSQTGGAQPHIHPKDINNLKVAYVRDIEEQKAIAEILSDMDKEIEQLEQKLAKTRLIKQGMMQQLLTGKIRLV